MPIVPDISLQVQPMQTGQTNIIGALGQAVDIRNKLNQNQLFQNTFAARQRMGQIIASAPDYQTGLERAAKDPLVAGFAGQDLGAEVANQQGLLGAESTKQNILQSAMSGIYQSLGQSIGHPEMFDKLMQARLKTVPPEMRGDVESAMQDLRTAVMPDGDQTTLEQYNKNAAAAFIGAGGSPAAVGGILGTTGLEQIGGAELPVLHAPIQGTPTGEPGGGFTVMPGGSGQLQLNAPGGANSTAGGGVPPAQTANAPAEGQQTAGNLSSLGTPLYDPKTDVVPPGTFMPGMRGLGGQKATFAGGAELNAQRLKDFAGPETTDFKNAQLGLTNVNYVDHALDTLENAGGFLTPGPGATEFGNIAATLNTMEKRFGLKQTFSPGVVAQAQELYKQTKLMGVTGMTQFIGRGREAAETINNFMDMVPTYENTYLGAKMILSSLKYAFQRQQDEFNFKQQWLSNPANQNNLNGADARFNAKFPPKMYVNQALADNGLTSDGKFPSWQAGAEAYKSGLIDWNTFKKTMKEQFPNSINDVKEYFEKNGGRGAPAKQAGGGNNAAAGMVNAAQPQNALTPGGQ